jgi:hypothetical protein
MAQAVGPTDDRFVVDKAIWLALPWLASSPSICEQVIVLVEAQAT